MQLNIGKNNTNENIGQNRAETIQTNNVKIFFISYNLVVGRKSLNFYFDCGKTAFRVDV